MNNIEVVLTIVALCNVALVLVAIYGRFKLISLKKAKSNLWVSLLTAGLHFITLGYFSELNVGDLCLLGYFLSIVFYILGNFICYKRANRKFYDAFENAESVSFESDVVGVQKAGHVHGIAQIAEDICLPAVVYLEEDLIIVGCDFPIEVFDVNKDRVVGYPFKRK